MLDLSSVKTCFHHSYGYDEITVCHLVILPQAAPILFSFRLPVCNARPIYIICVPTRNRNNECILEFILREIKMADFER